jgi:hypothetical protein
MKQELKIIVRRITARVVQYDLLWTLARKTVVKLADHIRSQREWIEAEKLVCLADAISRLSPDLKVRKGPFRGMIYPAAIASGSSLFPKLLGSYERELHSLIESLVLKQYDEVIDVGCAEGYYAVGLAMRLPKVEIHAYDSNPVAVEYCARMAEVNGVSSRVRVHGACTPDVLRNRVYRGGCLIISDCEGYESDLFTPEVVDAVKDQDVLIEIHDNFNINTSFVIKNRFSDTHIVQSIKSVDDMRKAHEYEYSELDGYTLAQRHRLLAERPCQMEWIFLRSKRRLRP